MFKMVIPKLTIFAILTNFVVLASHRTANAQFLTSRSIDLVGFDTRNFTAISEVSLGIQAQNVCVPISILNSILLSGASQMQLFRSSLTGSREQMATRIIQLAERTKPDVRSHGMYLWLSLNILRALSPAASSAFRLESKSFARHPDESYSQFTRRIHSLINLSIRNGFPPIISFTGIHATIEEGRQVWSTRTANSHAVLVTAIQNSISPNDDSFMLRILDPEVGNEFSVYVHSPENKVAYWAHRPDGYDENGVPSRWTWTERPHLLVESPNIVLNGNVRNWWERHVTMLTDGLGSFQPMNAR